MPRTDEDDALVYIRSKVEDFVEEMGAAGLDATVSEPEPGTFNIIVREGEDNAAVEIEG
jgi:hypothetical protein